MFGRRRISKETLKNFLMGNNHRNCAKKNGKREMLQKLLNCCQLIDEEMEVGEDSALKVQKEGENHLFTGT